MGRHDRSAAKSTKRQAKNGNGADGGSHDHCARGDDRSNDNKAPADCCPNVYSWCSIHAGADVGAHTRTSTCQAGGGNSANGHCLLDSSTAIYRQVRRVV